MTRKGYGCWKLQILKIRNAALSVFFAMLYLNPAYSEANNKIYAETEGWTIGIVGGNQGCLMSTKVDFVGHNGSMGIGFNARDNSLRIFLLPHTATQALQLSEDRSRAFQVRFENGGTLTFTLYYVDNVFQTSTFMAGHERITLLLDQMSHWKTSVSFVHEGEELALINLSGFPESLYLLTKCMEFIK